MRSIKVVAALVTAGALTVISAAMVDASTPPASPPVETEAPTTAAPDPTEAPTTAPATEAPTTIQVIITDPETTPAPATEAPTTGVLNPELTPIDSSLNPVLGGPNVTIEDQVALTSTSNPNQVNQDQQSVVTATVVANANTGSNSAIDNSGQPGGGQLPAEIATGTAGAIGSQDANVVTQGADITLMDQAVANVIQVALIINVGVALANSGFNGVSSTQGGAGLTAGVTTGDANATGLDIGQYITQAARETGDENTDAHAGQLAISLWMGLGTANTGLNTVAGGGVSGGSGGAVGAGNAAATGNLSTTNIDQYAELLGEDTATLNVTQRATVLNVGFALANSGINDISGVAGGLLSADPTDDNEYAQDLFAMLLPALLQSYGYGPAAGSIDTGNATATGNDSDTFVRQVALAASSGDGVVDIVQNVLVANMGAAAANTGGNVLGGGIQTLSPEDASAIVMMAAFMADMLSLVHQEANGATMDAVSRGIDVPFQGLLLRLDASFEGLDTTYTNEGGAQANMRQVTVIISLGLANANTGENTTQSQVNQGNNVNEVQSGDAVQVLALDEAGNIIGTGEADAGNQAQVVMCQRINADDIDCLAPPTTTIPPADPEPTTTTITTNVITPITVVAATTTTSVVVGATTTTTAVAPTTTCPAPPTTLPPEGASSVSLPPGFTPGMVLPATC
jgi:hypothetical protein